ncbi:MAG TPA: hypothetical protein VF832_19130, partial [Longimicrobiales bacterium]
QAPVVTAAAPAPAGAPLLATTQLYYDNGGGIRDSTAMVVRDAQAYAALWLRATSGQKAPPPAQPVDFAHEMVLAVGAGRMTPDDQIHVDSVSVQRHAGQGAAAVAFVTVTQGCGRFQADAYPLEIVRVRRFDGPVRFAVQRVRAGGCS